MYAWKFFLIGISMLTMLVSETGSRIVRYADIKSRAIFRRDETYKQEPPSMSVSIATSSPAASTTLALLQKKSDALREEKSVPVLEKKIPSVVLPRIPISSALPSTPRSTTTLPASASPSPAVSPAPVSSPVPATTTPPASAAERPTLPPLDLAHIFAAVVKIECISEDHKGKYVGSGFVLRRPGGNTGQGATVVTVAHLLMLAGENTCTVIFPNKDRAPSHWLKGTLAESKEAISERHDKEGIDVAMLTLAPVGEYPEAAAVFPDGYPFIPYPVCEDADMMGDMLIHFGYPSNYLNQSYLSKSDGSAIAYADIKGIETLLSEDQTSVYKSPVFSYVTDTQQLHPYMVSRVATFYGDSGGLAFNADKQCILGPQRGGTIGGGAGENVSIFPLLGWPKAKTLLMP